MAELANLRATVYGRVQGVFFRDFTRKRGVELGITGFVRNIPEGGVEVVAEGEKQKLSSLIDSLKKGPPGSIVKRVEIMWTEYRGKYSTFEIRY
jgi:acylphosphatase